MEGRLSRKRARISVVLIVLACALVLLGVVLDFKPCMFAGVVLMVAALLVLQWKCPHCGRRFKAMPQWSTYGSYYCTHCGKRLAYDDEPEELESEELLR